MSGEMSRRTMMKVAGLGALAAAAMPYAGCALAQDGAATLTALAETPRPYELPPLPYAYDALEPVLSAEIMRIHHDKHHAGYVKGFNDTLEKLQKARESGDHAQAQANSRALAFHGSGHVLHTLFWNSMTPGGSAPDGTLRAAIDRDFGSVDALKAQFLAAAKAVMSNGWGILAWEPLGQRLLVLQAERHQDMTIWGVTPLMVCDVWEHAYYLQYQNDRGKFVDNFWTIADWGKTSKRLNAAMAVQGA